MANKKRRPAGCAFLSGLTNKMNTLIISQNEKETTLPVDEEYFEMCEKLDKRYNVIMTAMYILLFVDVIALLIRNLWF